MRTIATLALLALGGSFATPAHADAAVTTRLDARGIKYEADDDGDYRVVYDYKKEGRTQLVFVSGRTQNVGGMLVREVFSPAARVADDRIDGAKALELLAESRNNKIGGWELDGDVLLFVIKLLDNVDAATLESAMDVAAQTADDMEIELSGSKDAL